MKNNKNFFAAVIIIGILLSLSILFVKPLEGFSWNPGVRTPTNIKTSINMDYPGNDIGYFESTNLSSCTKECQQTADCAGILTDFTPSKGPGQCWLKSKFENPTPNDNLHPFFLTV